MKESKFKADFKRDLKERMRELGHPVKVIENKASHRSAPDTIVLGRWGWAVLEFKKGSGAAQQPNQAYWVEDYDKLSYGAFVSPENAEEILDELEDIFAPAR